MITIDKCMLIFYGAALMALSFIVGIVTVAAAISYEAKHEYDREPPTKEEWKAGLPGRRKRK